MLFFQTDRIYPIQSALYIYFLLVFIPICSVQAIAQDITQSSQDILILNSYHKGYSWSDQTVSGIESTILHQYPGANIRIEYMDTKRNTSKAYFKKLFDLYQEKYSNPSEFDLIFATDDNAIEFLLDRSDTLFPTTPIVFCGANALETKRLRSKNNFTGVMERTNIKKTLDTIFALQPDISRIYIINDTTITGHHVAEELQKHLLSLLQKVEVDFLPDEPLDQLTKRVAALEENSAILLLAYLRDNEGSYYHPHETASRLSEVAPIPIYGVWDFYFKHGIIGGALTSGYLQGEASAEIGLEILDGEDINTIPINESGGSRLFLDYTPMQQFGLSLEQAPREAIVNNIIYDTSTKNVLFLHSYSPENKWTKAIIEGMDTVFANSGIKINSYTEFMDTKRYSDKPYFHSLSTIFAQKYSKTPLDLIVVSDDHAYNFLLRHQKLLFKSIPVVFCGVNYLPNPHAVNERGVTGVVESYDILGTIKLGLSIFPETKKIFVINDDSTTGKANFRRFNQISPQLPTDLQVLHSGQTSMQELLNKIAHLDDRSLVLLMSFTKDKNNHRFSFETSSTMITRESSRPVLGFWDFYLDSGILGGVITSGYDQGNTAATLAAKILQGRNVTTLPVVEESPVRSIVNYNQLERFGASPEDVPPDVTIRNQPYSFIDQFRSIVYTVLIIFSFLLILIGIQAIKIKMQKRKQISLITEAETDPLTGTKTRKFLEKSLAKEIEKAKVQNTTLTLCYFDLDNLKSVNDTFGHKSGDDYINFSINAIRKHIRSDDIICRVGGDEFIVILPNYTEKKAEELCLSINSDLAKNTLFGNIQLSVSCGISQFDTGHHVSAEMLIEMADSKMYQHKKAKRKKRV